MYMSLREALFPKAIPCFKHEIASSLEKQLLAMTFNEL